MKEKTYKCPCCERQVLVSEAVPYKNRYYHTPCFNNTMKQMTKQKSEKLKDVTPKKSGKSKKLPKIEVGDCVTGEEAIDKKQYFEKLQELTGGPCNAKMIKLSEDYQKRYKWEWSGMYECLVYVFELTERAVIGDCVGLLPYYYDEARRFYASRLKEQNKDIVFNEYYPAKEIKIKRPKSTMPFIDITEIGR